MGRRSSLVLGGCLTLAACGGDDGGDDGQQGILDQLVFDRTFLDFRGVPLKLEVVETLQITNTGIETLEIVDAAPDSRFSSDGYAFERVTSLPLSIPPGPPASLQFSFRASRPVRSSEARSTVTLEFGRGETVEVQLVGETASALDVSATTLDFGETLVGRPKSQTLSIRNTLNRPIPVYAQTVGGRARPEMVEGIGRFEIDAAVNSEGRLANASPLAAQNDVDPDARSSIDIEIRYLPDPAAVATDRARWRIGACPELEDDCSIEIEFVGQPLPSPVLCRSRDGSRVERLDFGNLNPPESETVTLECSVRAEVRLTDIARPLASTGIEVTDTLEAEPPVQLSTGRTFELTVAFDPSDLEAGTDVPEDTAVVLGLVDPAVNAPFESVEIAITGGHGRPELAIAPDRVDFGRAAVGTVRRERVRVTNTAPIPFSGRIRLEPGMGVDPSTFASEASGTLVDLDAGATETYALDFGPASMGTKSATLVFETNEISDPRNPNARFAVEMSGIAEDRPLCDVFLSADEIELGRTIPLTENRAYVAITNLDSEPCLVDGIRLAPGADPEIRLVDPPSEVILQPEESTLVELGYVTDRPADAEDLEATATLEMYISSEPSMYEIPVSGSQSTRALVRAPNVVDLRAGDTTCGTYAQEVDLLNGGATPVTVTSIDITGDDAFAFDLDLGREPPFAIDALTGRETFEVVLDPSLADETLVSAQVEIAIDDADAPFVVPVLARAELGSFFEEGFVQGDFSQVDTVFVLPGSGAGPALARAASGFRDYQAPVQQAGMTYHIGFVTGVQSALCSAAVPAEPASIEHEGACGLLASGPVGVEYREEWRVIDGSETAPGEEDVFSSQMQKPQFAFGDFSLQSAHLALHPTLVAGWNAEIHRPGSLLHLVFLNTADDASPADVAFYSDMLRYARGYPRRFDTVASAITGPETGTCSSPLGGIFGSPAPRLRDAAARVGGGPAQSICNGSWSALMSQVGVDATGIRRRVRLARPANGSSVEITVDGDPLPRSNGPEVNWSFDSSRRVVTFRDPSALASGAEIRIAYRPSCATQ